jgi:hypothetical protein
METENKTATVAELKSGQRVYDAEFGVIIHSGLAVEEGLKIKEPREYIFFTDPEDEETEPERIVIKDPNRIVELLT